MAGVRELIADAVRVDWAQVRLGRAFSGLVAMLAVVAFLGVVGDPAIAALLAALFTTAAGGGGPMTQRLPRMVRFTIIGAVVGGLAFWSLESASGIALVLGGATYIGTLAAAEGPAAAKAGLLMTLWPLFALLLGSVDTEPWTVMVGFLVGGSVAVVVTALRLRVQGAPDESNDDAPDPEDRIPGRSLPERLRGAATSPIGIFAALRAVAVGAAVLLGYWMFNAYPLWVAVTVIVVVKPSASQSLSVTVQRTLGTAIGVAFAIVYSQAFPRSDAAIVVAFLLCGLLMLAFNNANYALFATFLTATLVLGQRLVEADAFEAGWQRLLATIVGALIAIVVLYVATALGRRLVPGDSTA